MEPSGQDIFAALTCPGLRPIRQRGLAMENIVVAGPLRFTHTEFQRIVALATKMLYERCKTDKDSLCSFLWERLCLAPLESEPIHDRCQQDAAYLHSLVADYVNRLDEQGLRALLADLRVGTAIADQLGFDPFDPKREDAFRRAQRIFNPRQGLALAAGVLVCLVMGSFPPWVEQTWEKHRGLLLVIPMSDTKLVEEKFHGYGFLFSPRPESPRVQVRRPSGMDWGTYRYTRYRLDHRTLLGQWLLVALATTVAVVLLRDKKWSADRYVASLRPTISTAP